MNTAPITFQRVEHAAPLKLKDSKVITLLRDNAPTLFNQRPNSQDEPEGITALYERLSKDDDHTKMNKEKCGYSVPTNL